MSSCIEVGERMLEPGPDCGGVRVSTRRRLTHDVGQLCEDRERTGGSIWMLIGVEDAVRRCVAELDPAPRCERPSEGGDCTERERRWDGEGFPGAGVAGFEGPPSGDGLVTREDRCGVYNLSREDDGWLCTKV